MPRLPVDVVKVARDAENADALEQATASLAGRLEWCPASELWSALFAGNVWRREYDVEGFVTSELEALGFRVFNKHGTVRDGMVFAVVRGLKKSLSTATPRKVFR